MYDGKRVETMQAASAVGIRRHVGEALGILACTVVTAGCGGGAPEVAVALTDHAFEPRQFSIGAGRRTVIALENKGTVDHNLVVVQLNLASPSVAPGKTAKFEVTAPQGTYRLVCNLPGHEDLGMVGQITVSRR